MIRIVINPKLTFPGVNVLKNTNKSNLSFALQTALQREWINKNLTKQTTDDHRQKNGIFNVLDKIRGQVLKIIYF